MDAERALDEELPGTPLLPRSEAQGFDVRDPWLVPRLPASRGPIHRARVALPTRAIGAFELIDDDSKMRIEVALRHATDAPVEISEGYVVYPGALPGADVVHRIHAGGTEDYVAFGARPPEEAIAYELALGTEVAGLRLVSDVVELLDPGGAPRLRMGAPYVVDAEGVVHPASVAVDGCAYDVDPRAPWGRPPTAPGAAHCTVRIAWKVDRYPAVVDPAWTATGSMTTARSAHVAARLANGMVLVAGGYTASGSLESAELYDPATGTFAATGTMMQARRNATANLLASGKVLVAGGEDWGGGGTLTSAELYDPTTGTFSATGSMSAPRSDHTASVLGSGKVLVTGGHDSSGLPGAELYDPVLGTFAPTGAVVVKRRRHSATVLGSGKVLIAGGHGSGYLSSAELYDPVLGTFAPTGSMVKAHLGHAAALLGTGKVLVAGGVAGGLPNDTLVAELYDPATETFSLTGAMTFASTGGGTASLLPSGKVLVLPNVNAPIAEVYDPSSGAFINAGPSIYNGSFRTATVLTTGAVLVAGGESVGQHQAVAELYQVLDPGVACTNDGQCSSNTCADGICCDSACAGGVCRTCAPGTGACTLVTNADDPETCTGQNTCDALGNCKLKNGNNCNDDAACASGFCAPDGKCCDTACNGTCQTCWSGTCTQVTNNDDPDTCTAPNQCGPTGICAKPNGQPCASANECASGFCEDGLCCNMACDGSCAACNGATLGWPGAIDGYCADAPWGYPGDPSCSPYLCNGVQFACPTWCDTHSDCIAGFYCDGIACLPKQPAGGPCDSDDPSLGGEQCTTSFCIDDVCCLTDCSDPCYSCRLVSRICG